MNISIDNLDSAVESILENYATDLREALNAETESAAEELKKSISADAPVKTGKQKRSWRVTTEKIAGVDLRAIVHSTDYRKVHLLENGHLTRDGRTRTKAIGYVRKNEEKIVEKYEHEVARVLEAVK